MAQGDYHVSKKRGAWVIEEEGLSKRKFQLIETMPGRDQAWHIALFYGYMCNTDVFLHLDGQVKKEKKFRPVRRTRRA